MYHLQKKRYHARQAIKLVRIHMISAVPLASVAVHQLMSVVLDLVVTIAILMHHATMIPVLNALNDYNAAGVLPLGHVSQQ